MEIWFERETTTNNNLQANKIAKYELWQQFRFI